MDEKSEAEKAAEKLNSRLDPHDPNREHISAVAKRKRSTFEAQIRRGYTIRIGDEIQVGPVIVGLPVVALYMNLHKVDNISEAYAFLELPAPRDFSVEATAIESVRRVAAIRGAGNIDSAAIAAAIAGGLKEAIIAITPSLATAVVAAIQGAAEAARPTRLVRRAKKGRRAKQVEAPTPA